MSGPEDLGKVQEKLEKLTERVTFLQNLAWVIGGIAIALGLGGAGLWTTLQDLRKSATDLNVEVEGYRAEAKRQAETINAKIQEALQPALFNALTRVSEERVAALKAIGLRESEALAALLVQEQSSVAAVSKQVLLGNNCMIVTSVQVCWGTETLERSSSNPHVAGFSFDFGKEFAETPNITGSPSTNGSGHMLAIYKWTATRSSYNGTVGNIYIGKALDAKLFMSYIAIGRPSSK